MRIGRFAVTLGLVVTSVLGAAPTAEDPAMRGVGTENLTHVTNLSFEERPDLGDSLRLATEVDFLTFTAPEGYVAPDSVPVDLRPAPGETRELAVVGTQVNGMQVVDITEPEAPAVVAVYECAVAQADVNLFEREDLGRTFAAYTSDNIAGQHDHRSRCHRDNRARPGSYGTFLIELTDPYRPESTSFIPFDRGTHQATVHPGGRWLYSSPNGLGPVTAGGSRGLGKIDIVDISDPAAPAAPTAVLFDSGIDGHDLAFNDDGTRAYVAAVTHTVVLDTTDPGAPTVVGRILDPAVQTHHDAHPITASFPGVGERELVVISDELVGAAGNGYCPGGGLHFFDVTGPLEHAPVKLGAFYAPDVLVQEGGRSGLGGLVRCTAHVIQVHPEHQLLTVAWFGAGVRVLDYSGLMVGAAAGIGPETGAVGTGLREVAFHRFPDSDVWAAKTNHIEDDGSFYLYAIDTVRMFDVYRFDASAEATVEGGGRWVDPSTTIRPGEIRRSSLPASVPLRQWCSL